jgi:UDP-N-acetylmuramate dehydrogenase
VREAVIRIRVPGSYPISRASQRGKLFQEPAILTREEKENLLKRAVPDAPVYDAGKNRFKTSAAYLIDKAGYKG